MVVVLSTQQTDYGGSIGTTWPPEYDEDNDRIKGFYTDTIDSSQDIDDPIELLEQQQDDYGAERISCRFLIQDAMIDDLETASLQQEAAISLDDSLEDYSLVYLGTVEGDRDRPGLLQEEHERIRGPAFEADPYRSQQEVPYDIQLLDEPDGATIDALQDLYQDRYTAYPIDFTEENVRDLFEGENLVAAAYEDDCLVGAYVAEVASIPLQETAPEDQIRLAELTEAATARNHEGEGIGTALGQLLLSELAVTDIDVVYGEARADIVGVNVSAARMGRSYAGTLPNHCKIGGDTTDLREEALAETLTNEQYQTLIEDPFGSLNVWAITNAELDTQYR